MKMCLKLAYYAFSSSPPKDPILCWSLHLLMSFFPSKTRLQISVCVASVGVCVGVCVCVCVCVCVYMYIHWTYLDVSQAITGNFFECILQKMVGWVTLRFVIALCWSLNRSKCDGQCLFSSLVIAIPALHVKCHSLQERNVPGNVLIVDHHVKKKLCIYIH